MSTIASYTNSVRGGSRGTDDTAPAGAAAASCATAVPGPSAASPAPASNSPRRITPDDPVAWPMPPPSSPPPHGAVRRGKPIVARGGSRTATYGVPPWLPCRVPAG